MAWAHRQTKSPVFCHGKYGTSTAGCTKWSSICLSHRSISAVAGFLLSAWLAKDIDRLLHGAPAAGIPCSAPLSSKCRQCPVDTHARAFNGPLNGTTRVSRYQKGKTNLDFTEARDSEWQWHQLSHMQVCTSLQTDNHASTPPLSFLQAGCLTPNQQHRSTEGSDSMLQLNTSSI